MIVYRYQQNTQQVMKMKKDNGEMAKNNQENTEVFQKHFTKLYNQVEGTNFDP